MTTLSAKQRWVRRSKPQSLCYSCNAMKRDTDDTDFRGVKQSYEERVADCVFCEIPRDRVIAENELAYAILDAFPVTEHHTLIIPKRHISDYFSLYQPERNAMQSLLEQRRGEILKIDPTVTGFNVGNNIGEPGQTVMHCHTHLTKKKAMFQIHEEGEGGHSRQAMVLEECLILKPYKCAYCSTFQDVWSCWLLRSDINTAERLTPIAETFCFLNDMRLTKITNPSDSSLFVPLRYLTVYL